MIEPALPEPCHLARPVDQRRERAELRAIVRLPPCVAVADQPGLPQHAEMLRYGRLRDAGPRRQGPDRLLSFPAQPFEDGPPGRIGERSEEHIVSVRHLWIDNLLAIDRRITAGICMSQARTRNGTKPAGADRRSSELSSSAAPAL